MAAKKDKFLESAQKSLKKKQFPRAIKDFEKVVEIDPSDVRSRQKLAELLVKTGRNEDAYEHFEAVAKYFSTNGFYLKAIAIYKQMQRIDPSQVSLFSRLAELNEKQGLLGNAMAEYRNLISYYERNGMVADVISVLEKMRDLDATNLNVRVKLAEVYTNNDRADDGLSEFEGVLETLTEKGDYDKILKLYKMFMPLFPDNEKLKMGLALALYEKGELQKGITILEGLLEDKPEDPDLLRLIARGYHDLEDWPNVISTNMQLLTLDPTDLEIREQYINAQIAHGQYDQALSELEEWKERLLKADRLDQLKAHYETLKEQLPDNPAVLQTLDSIYELTGEGDKLLDIISEQEEEETTEPNLEETLSDSILASANDDIDLPMIDIEVPSDEIELETDEIILDEDEELILEAPEEDQDLQLDALEDDSLVLEEIDEEKETVIELDLKEEDAVLEADELELSFDLPEEEGAASAASPQPDISAQLEEAEFYIQQGLYVEAEKICTDILTYAPDSEECQKKLNVILSYLNQAEQEESTVVQSMDVELTFDEADDTEEGGDDFFAAFDEEEGEQKVFRTDVDEQIAADDMESHYNLGIAYREMGLLDDAISEFAKAEKDPSRFVDCQTLKGLCYSDKGDFANAEIMYQQALDSQHLEADQRLSLGYELGSLYESTERMEDALSSYRSVLAQDETFRDVKEKVNALQESLGVVVEDEIVNKERISFL